MANPNEPPKAPAIPVNGPDWIDRLKVPDGAESISRDQGGPLGHSIKRKENVPYYQRQPTPQPPRRGKGKR